MRGLNALEIGKFEPNLPDVLFEGRSKWEQTAEQQLRGKKDDRSHGTGFG
jgi:hypothetical protein